jgi:hypothetical protein
MDALASLAAAGLLAACSADSPAEPPLFGAGARVRIVGLARPGDSPMVLERDLVVTP